METIKEIKERIINPERDSLHLRELAETITLIELGRERNKREDREFETTFDRNSEKLAYFIYLVWGHTGNLEYPKRTYEHLRAIEDSMAGMYAPDRWNYALNRYAQNVCDRLTKLGNITITPQETNSLMHGFFEPSSGKEYLRTIAERLLWKQSERISRTERNKGKGFSALKSTMTALVSYVEQENIAHGDAERPLDDSVIFSNLVGIQDYFIKEGRYSGRFEQGSWSSAIDQLVEDVNSRFGTPEGIEKAKELRRWYKNISREKHLEND
jgi:hypothetical protein